MSANVGGVFLAQNEKQRDAILKLKDLIRRLTAIRPPHEGGMIFPEGEQLVDANGVCKLRIILQEGLAKAESLEVVVAILQDDYVKTVEKIYRAYEACVRALFLERYAPDLHNNEVGDAKIVKTPSVKSMRLM